MRVHKFTLWNNEWTTCQKKQSAFELSGIHLRINADPPLQMTRDKNWVAASDTGQWPHKNTRHNTAASSSADVFSATENNPSFVWRKLNKDNAIDWHLTSEIQTLTLRRIRKASARKVTCSLIFCLWLRRHWQKTRGKQCLDETECFRWYICDWKWKKQAIQQRNVPTEGKRDPHRLPHLAQTCSTVNCERWGVAWLRTCASFVHSWSRLVFRFSSDWSFSACVEQGQEVRYSRGHRRTLRILGSGLLHV